LVAIGLIHVNRDLPGNDSETDWRWCLNLAREAAKAYLAAIRQDNRYVPATQSTTVASDVRSTWDLQPEVKPPATPPPGTAGGVAGPAVPGTSSTDPETTARSTTDRARTNRVRLIASVVVVAVALLAGLTAGRAFFNPAGGRTGPAASASAEAPLTPTLRIDPQAGRPGTAVRLDGSGFIRGEPVRVEIFAGVGLKDFAGPYLKGDRTANANGEIRELYIEIDREICCVGATIFIRATGRKSHAAAEQTFRLT